MLLFLIQNVGWVKPTFDKPYRQLFDEFHLLYAITTISNINKIANNTAYGAR